MRNVHLGRSLSLDVSALANKVIEQQRGGFCYELNGLFCALLNTVGFEAWLGEARTREDDGGLGPRFDHARIVAAGGGPWLVDVGAGVSPRGPIRLSAEPQNVAGTWHRVVERDGRFDCEEFEGGQWRFRWSFDATPRRLADFVERSGHHQRSPESHFTHKPICTLVTEDGHLTLADRQLITVRAGRRVEEQVDDPLCVLASRFGVVLPSWPGA